MCLDRRYTVEEKKEFLDTIDTEWIEVWKMVGNPAKFHNKNKRWYSWFQFGTYEDGHNKCPKSFERIKTGNGKKYTPYYHFYLGRPLKEVKDNVRASYCQKIIICYVRKKDISTVGTQNLAPVYESTVTIVAREAFFPAYPNTDLTNEEKIKYGIPIEAKEIQNA